MDAVGQMGGQIVEGVKTAAKAATIEPLKGLGKVATGVAIATVSGGAPVTGQNEEQIKQKDAQELARARQRLAQFNAQMKQVYQQTEQQKVEEKRIEEQEKQQTEAEKSQKKKAQEEALLRAQKSGGTEAGREVK